MAKLPIESLESRLLLSSATLNSAGRLLVAGDPSSANDISVGLSSDGSAVDVTINGGAAESFNAAKVARVVVEGGSQNDTLTLDESAHPFNLKARIFSGGGADTVAAGSLQDDLQNTAGGDVVKYNHTRGQFVAQPTTTPPTLPTVATGTVDGTVTDSTGAAVSGAFVALHLVPPANANGAPPLFSFAHVLCATTDSTGAFDLSNVPVGSYNGVADLPGTGLATFTVTVTANQTSDVTVALQPVPTPQPLATGTVQGTVTDSTGNAAVDVGITLVRDFALPATAAGNPVGPPPVGATLPTGGIGNIGLLQFPFNVLHTTTDSNGNFTLDNVPVGSYVAVAFSETAGFVRTDVTVTKGQTTTVNIALPAAVPPPAQGTGTVTGTVDDSTAAAIVGAQVTLIPALATPLGGSGASLPPVNAGGLVVPLPGKVLHATTDSNGDFTLTGVPAGTYTAITFKPGYAPGNQSVTVTANQTSTLAITLDTLQITPPPTPTTGTLTGTVVDSTGNAAGGASVVLGFLPTPLPVLGSSQSSAAMLPSPLFLQTTTAADGSFELDNVPTGTYFVLVSDPGVGYSRTQVTISDNQTTTVTITLSLTAPPPVTPPPVGM